MQRESECMQRPCGGAGGEGEQSFFFLIYVIEV